MTKRSARDARARWRAARRMLLLVCPLAGLVGGALGYVSPLAHGNIFEDSPPYWQNEAGLIAGVVSGVLAGALWCRWVAPSARRLAKNPRRAFGPFWWGTLYGLLSSACVHATLVVVREHSIKVFPILGALFGGVAGLLLGALMGLVYCFAASDDGCRMEACDE